MRPALLLLAFALAPLACGGEETPATPLVQLSSAGVSPSSITVASSAALRFVNKDSADHQLASTDCSELASPKLSAGGSFTATLGAGPKTCTYKDSLAPSASAFQGTVTVQAPGSGGGGGGGGGPGY